MSENEDKSPANGEVPAVGEASEVPRVAPAQMPTGDLIVALWHGMEARRDLMGQLMMAKMAAKQDKTLSMSIEFQTNFKEAKKKLELARDGCDIIQRELNARFAGNDAMRSAMAGHQDREA